MVMTKSLIRAEFVSTVFKISNCNQACFVWDKIDLRITDYYQNDISSHPLEFDETTFEKSNVWHIK